MKHLLIRHILLVGFLLGSLFLGWYVWRRQECHQRAELLGKALQEKPLVHLGIVMDGNRRWARNNGYKPWIGHRHGVKPLKTAVKFCCEYGISHLTVYTLSIENLQRPADELSFLFDVLAEEIASTELDALVQQGVRVRFVGDRRRFPERLTSLIKDVEEKTAHNNLLYLNLLFCYGGKQEIIDAMRTLCDQGAQIPLDDKEAEMVIEEVLWSKGIPPIDLLIRTGGEQRISNFFLFKIPYSEIFFLNCYWPDIVKDDLVNAALRFTQAQRRYGR